MTIDMVAVIRMHAPDATADLFVSFFLLGTPME
jgi:hypothetical protein